MSQRLREQVAGGLTGILAIVVVGAALAVGVRWLFLWTTEQALIRYAERNSQGWVEYLQTEMPNLEELLEGRPPDARQRVVIYFASAIGDAISFRLYDANGAPALDSDHALLDGPRLPDARPDAWLAVEEGRTFVNLLRGRETAGGPDVAAQVALPLFDVDGRRIGSAHLVLDMSASSASMGAILLRTGAGLTALVALAFLGPALGWHVIRGRARRAEDAVRRLAEQDPLTGLINRKGFVAAAEALRRSEEGPRMQLMLICVDVDRFKAFNDQHGRVAGDALLRRLALALRGGLRRGDLVARTGPDDFAALMSIRDPKDADALLGRVGERAQAALPVDAGPAGSVCLGGYLLDRDADDIELALRRSEIALHEARAISRPGAMMFEPRMETRARRRREVERWITEGMAKDRFSLAFQPLVNRETRRTQGFEALMRLRDGDGAPVSPGEFIPVAEEMGVINRLGAWAIEQAAASAAAWPEPMTVSVNLSVQQFGDGRLGETVRAALQRTGLPPQRFELEVTESLLISDLEGVSRQLEELKSLGVGIAMDDFGTGYSSLAYLWRFGFDRLKLDRSFVQALGVDETRARDVIGAIVALGHRLGMSVTAEGIETDREESLLADLGCDVFQGFLFGKPMSQAELHEVMEWTADADAALAPPLSDRAAG
ncbi:MAG: bifunctional diguanylate cyclase/phosphodiesterase [Pseudomonadota bacterium]